MSLDRIERLSRAVLVTALALTSQACMTIVGPAPGDMPPPMPLPPALPEGNAGSNFHPSTSMLLFGDVRARNVGDTLTVILSERTQASKSASTGFAKDSSFESGQPIVAGREPTLSGRNVLRNDWDTDQSFDGTGSSQQSNSLTGDITVTVVETLANGNLRIRGEKWLQLNQGKEYIQVSGIVRPVDISTDNAVLSSQVADARISYSGTGDIANANRPGVVARFFNKFWPL